MWNEIAEIQFWSDTDDDSRTPEVHYHSAQNRRLMIIPSQCQNHLFRKQRPKSFYLKLQNNIRKLIKISKDYDFIILFFYWLYRSGKEKINISGSYLTADCCKFAGYPSIIFNRVQLVSHNMTSLLRKHYLITCTLV